MALNASGINPHFSDPRRFLRFSTASANLGANVSAYFTGAADAIDRHGVDDDTNYSAGVAKTILNIASGSGYLAGVIGPTLTNVADTATFTITVDGAAYSILVTNQVAAGRCMLGLQGPAAIFTTADRIYSVIAGVSSEASTIYSSTPNYRAPVDVETGIFFGQGMLYFSASLKIEVTSSINQTGTANQERRSGALYRRLS